VPAAREGVTCVVCHAGAHDTGEPVVPLGASAPPFPVRPSRTMLGSFGRGGAGDPRPVRNAFHRSDLSPALSESSFCRACHEVSIDRSPPPFRADAAEPIVHLQETYTEWAASRYAAEGVTCQDCHMARAEAEAPAALAPPDAAFEAPLPPRPRSDHRFAGPDVPYWQPAYGESSAAAAAAAALLKDAAALSLSVPEGVVPGEEIEIGARIANTGAGHDLPSGFTFDRELWLEVIVEDAGGRALFASGRLDEAGRLLDERNPRVLARPERYDGYLLSLRGRMVRVEPASARVMGTDRRVELDPAWVDARRNPNGTPILDAEGADTTAILASAVDDPSAVRRAADAPRLVEVFLQTDADTVVKNGIPAGGVRTARYPVPVPADAGGPLRVRARLLLRPMPAFVLEDVLALTVQAPVFELAGAEAAVPVR
jgi:hypothetical protein